MPQVTPLGITYQANETIWGYTKPVSEVVPNHEWKQTGQYQSIPNQITGETDILYEWQVMHVNADGAVLTSAASAVGQLKQEEKLAIAALVVWWLLG